MLFLIEYKNPGTGAVESVEKEFHATNDPTLPLTAKDWAEDYAYMLADKGWYRVTEKGA